MKKILLFVSFLISICSFGQNVQQDAVPAMPKYFPSFRTDSIGGILAGVIFKDSSKFKLPGTGTGTMPIVVLSPTGRLDTVSQSSIGGVTNIGSTQNATNYLLTSSTGTGTTLLVATATKAGLIDSAHYNYLDSLYTGKKVFNLYAGNVITFSGGDTINWNGPLISNTNITGGGSFSVSLGTNASDLSNFSVYSNSINFITQSGGSIVNNGPVNMLALTVANGTSNYTATSDNFAELITPTANRTVTLPTAAGNNGRIFTLFNFAGSASFSWTYATTVKDVWGNTITAIPNGCTDQLYYDGTNWILQRRGFLNNQLVTPGWQTITSGSSGVVNDNQTNVLINPASLIATYTLTLPANPTDGMVVILYAGGTITGTSAVVTSFTVSANSGQTIMQKAAPTTLLANDCLMWKYNAALTFWYRMQ